MRRHCSVDWIYCHSLPLREAVLQWRMDIHCYVLLWLFCNHLFLCMIHLYSQVKLWIIWFYFWRHIYCSCLCGSYCVILTMSRLLILFICEHIFCNFGHLLCTFWTSKNWVHRLLVDPKSGACWVAHNETQNYMGNLLIKVLVNDLSEVFLLS